MKAVILFSGGVDSTVALAIALEKGRECLALSFDYGQKHRIELDHAVELTKRYGIAHKIIKLDPEAFGNSALLSRSTSKSSDTYVPARNTIFIAYAIGIAEDIGAEEIYAGPNAMDYNNYPDCRPEYIEAMQGVINLATKKAPPSLITPLIHMNKSEIFLEGKRLDVPFDLTFSCYDPVNGKACGKCDACLLRQDGLRALHDSPSERGNEMITEESSQ